MDMHNLEDNQQALEDLAALHEGGLGKFGIELNAFAEDIKNMLNKCADTQMLTGLHDMDELYLNEFYLQKRKEQIDNQLAAGLLRAEIDDLKKQIQHENEECDLLKKFVSQSVPSEKQYRMTLSSFEADIKNLQSKLEELNLAENVDIEGIIKKIEILKARENEVKNK